MNILLTNDDGYDSEGIRRLVGALARVADVYVCAPKTQMSASGHGITIVKRVSVHEISFAGAAGALAVEGTPADCVKIGLYRFEGAGVAIDKVFSGINHGANLGTDTLYSGTVSAALEGVMSGKPSVALSVGARNPEHFDAACRIAAHAATLPADAHGAGTALNINTPNLPPGEMKGVKITRLGVMEYEERFDEDFGGVGGVGYIYAGRQVFRSKQARDVDITAHHEGYATITPLRCDLTDPGLISGLKTQFRALDGLPLKEA